MVARVLVIGVGNVYRGDDGVGLAVVRALRARKIENARLMESDGNCTTLLEAWQTASKVILVDAVLSGASAGTISRFDASYSQDIPTTYTFFSTHAFSIAETLALARILDQLPPCFIIYGIEGKSFTSGEKLSPPVKKAIGEVVKQVMLDIANAGAVCQILA